MKPSGARHRHPAAIAAFIFAGGAVGSVLGREATALVGGFGPPLFAV